MARSGIRRGDGYISERVTKSGATRYNARWQDGGNWKSKTFGTRDEAEDHLRTVGRQKRDGRYEPESKMTVRDIVTVYMERNRDTWSSNTYANYVTIRENIIIPAFGHRVAAHLRSRDIRILFDRLEKEYSPSRLVVIRAVLSGAFREALERGIIDRNPVSGIKLKQPDEPEIEVWTPEEIARLLAHVADDARMNAWYRVALTTGMRPGEMRAMRWADLDLDVGYINVVSTVSRDERFRPVIKQGTKTGKGRIVDIPAGTVAALRAWRPRWAEMKLRAKQWHDTDLVFPRADGWISSQQTHARHHYEICVGAGIRYLKPHGSRHTVVTTLLDEGVDEKLVGQIVGHTRRRTTRRYNHPTRAAHRRAAALLDRHVGMRESVCESVSEDDHDEAETV